MTAALHVSIPVHDLEAERVFSADVLVESRWYADPGEYQRGPDGC